MSRQATEVWLAEFQRSFGSTLRTPLDAASGTFRAQPARYDSQLVAAIPNAGRERLAVYNRQYWFRLFTAMQTSWPLTARLLGMFHFNQHAQRFLLQHPPSHFDLRVVTHGFERYLTDTLDAEHVDRGPRCARLPTRALLEAAVLDAAFAKVFYAPAMARFDPSACTPAALVTRRLLSSSAYARVEEHWPLSELRLALKDDGSEQALTLPAPLPAAQAWALFRTIRGVTQLRLEPLQARLYSLLETHPLGSALAQLEAAVDPTTRATLPEQTQAWMAVGIANGFWVGLYE
ncbi:MAG TPA: putative DNA-binding domain-containing protein [Polyangiales bacterium]|jgi:hypothetical protein|nr:putative DNA-binding domain-containing protein [Polyangiales bacterium]